MQLPSGIKRMSNKMMNALNLFFHHGLLFDTTFVPIHDLDISKDTIYTIWEQEASLQEKMVKNESNNEGSSHEEGGIVKSGESIGEPLENMVKNESNNEGSSHEEGGIVESGNGPRSSLYI